MEYIQVMIAEEYMNLILNNELIFLISGRSLLKVHEECFSSLLFLVFCNSWFLSFYFYFFNTKDVRKKKKKNM